MRHPAVIFGLLLVLLAVLAGCSDPVSSQIDRDERQADLNRQGADETECPPGEVWYPGAGSAWYIEPTPGGCGSP